MLIKMTSTWGTTGGVIPIGREIDVPEQQAVQLVGDGFAKYVGPVDLPVKEAVVVSLDDMMYKELVAACKKAGINASGKKKELRARLKALEEVDEVDDDQPPVDERAILDTPENTAVRTKEG